MSSEQDLQHELAAEISDREHDEARNCIARCLAPAPAEAPAPDQQARENRPRCQREHRLVHEVLLEQVGHEQETREDRDGKSRHTDRDHREQGALETLDRRQRRDPAGRTTASQCGVLQSERHYEYGGDRKHTGGAHGENNVHRERPVCDGDLARRREAARAGGEKGGQSENNRGDTAKTWREQGKQASGSDREPHQRGTVGEPQCELAEWLEGFRQPGPVRDERRRREVRGGLAQHRARSTAPCGVQGRGGRDQIEENNEKSAQ